MQDRAYDVLVVGARCAGSPLAIKLARGGLRVLMVDRATFPADTISTHIFQVEGINRLDRLGVLDQLLAESQAPMCNRLLTEFDGEVYDDPAPLTPDDRGWIMSVRRHILDYVLVRAAKEAGVEVWEDSSLRRLTWQDGRVNGASIDAAGGQVEVTARLVVGADGASSTVGRVAGARRYHVRASERIGMWGYFHHQPPGDPLMSFHFQDDRIGITAQGDNGLRTVIALPGVDELPAARQDPAAYFDRYLRGMATLPETLDSPREGDITLFKYPDGFFRESAGPGWALVGDAGHFKDPTPGQGISDALRQADRLGDEILEAARSRRSLDTAAARFAAWRDDDAFGKHHWASDLGRAGAVPALRAAVFRRLASTPEGRRRVAAVGAHRARPSTVFTPLAGARGLVDLLRSQEVPRREAISQFRALVKEEAGRAKERKHPTFTKNPHRRPPLTQATLTVQPTVVDGITMPTLVGGPTSGSGDPDPEAIVFLHGNPGSKADFADVAASAATFARVVVPDLVGFNDADKPPDFGYRHGDYLRLVDGLLAEHRVARAHLVVHDFGGIWGLGWAARNLDRVASLTIINTGVLLGYDWHRFAKAWRTPRLGELMMRQPAPRRVFASLINAGQARPLDDDAIGRLYDVSTDPATGDAVLKMYREQDPETMQREANVQAAALGTLDVPVKVIFGARDPYIPLRIGEVQTSVFAQAELAVLDDSGHWPFHDDPDRFASELLPFLRDNVGHEPDL